MLGYTREGCYNSELKANNQTIKKEENDILNLVLLIVLIGFAIALLFFKN